MSGSTINAKVNAGGNVLNTEEAALYEIMMDVNALGSNEKQYLKQFIVKDGDECTSYRQDEEGGAWVKGTDSLVVDDGVKMAFALFSDDAEFSYEDGLYTVKDSLNNIINSNQELAENFDIDSLGESYGLNMDDMTEALNGIELTFMYDDEARIVSAKAEDVSIKVPVDLGGDTAADATVDLSFGVNMKHDEISIEDLRCDCPAFYELVGEEVPEGLTVVDESELSDVATEEVDGSTTLYEESDGNGLIDGSCTIGGVEMDLTNRTVADMITLFGVEVSDEVMNESVEAHDLSMLYIYVIDGKMTLDEPGWDNKGDFVEISFAGWNETEEEVPFSECLVESVSVKAYTGLYDAVPMAGIATFDMNGINETMPIDDVVALLGNASYDSEYDNSKYYYWSCGSTSLNLYYNENDEMTSIELTKYPE